MHETTVAGTESSGRVPGSGSGSTAATRHCHPRPRRGLGLPSYVVWVKYRAGGWVLVTVTAMWVLVIAMPWWCVLVKTRLPLREVGVAKDVLHQCRWQG